MSLLIQYLLKLSISLAIVWLFYQFVLRRLTFYNSNRWYLLVCTMLAFMVPFINIAPVIGNEGDEGIVMRFIPAVQQYVAWGQATDCPAPVGSGMDKWDWMIAALVVGATFFLMKFIIRCISFFLMRRKARLISAGDVNLFQVDKDIIPFSFGNSIFINQQLHNDTELKEIIRHEFVHVKQKHTHDIIWGELLCILNWYNPFAWLIRNAIRQNLEFIADNKVLENGLDKKQYQYLLLKVIGNRHFSIANQFNFSSLKKRIAMMNKVKSARSHLLKFLFLLPLGGLLLVAFRNQENQQNQQEGKKQGPVAQQQIRSAAHRNEVSNLKPPKIDSIYTLNAKRRKDTVPNELLNDKGYYIEVTDNKGNCTLIVWNKSKKEVARLLLTKWNENKAHYENLYGEIHVPPAPSAPPAPPAPPTPTGSAQPPQPPQPGQPASFHAEPAPKADGVPGAPAAPSFYATPDAPPTPIAPPKLPENVEHIIVSNNKAVVGLKNGTIETYDLNDAKQKKAFETKYGKMPTPPPPPTHPSKKVRAVKAAPEIMTTPVEVVTTVDMKMNIIPSKPEQFAAKRVIASVKVVSPASVKVKSPVHTNVTVTPLEVQ